MTIRREQEDDKEAVRRVHLEAFGDSGLVVADLVDDLRKLLTPSKGTSLVAEEDGEVVGHVMLSPSLLDAPAKLVEVLVLSPLAVTPEHQKRGIGSALVQSGLAAVREQGFPLVFLEGSPDYYGRFGFKPGRELNFRRPSLRIPERAFQVIPLGESCDSPLSGTLVYSEIFWRHDAVGLREG